MEREPEIGDLVEIRPSLPVLGKVVDELRSSGRIWIKILWPSGEISTHEKEKFWTVVSANRLNSYSGESQE